MSTYVSSVDPPDLGLLPTFRRLLRLWREQWKLGAFSLTCALAYTLISIAIPILISRAIDNAIVPHEESKLPPYLAAIGGLALLRFVINFNRRYATARIGIRIEARMRELLYQAYLRYPRAFYDRHATGQVLSRATNDLYPIRYFIGWGLVQGMQSVMMIVGAGIVLGLVNWELTLIAAVSLPLIGYVANRFGRLVSPISREVQARKGDVTESADEAVVGIEMVQAFGREDDVRGRFGDRAEGVRAAALRQAGVEAQHVPGLYYLPGPLDRGSGLLRRPRSHPRRPDDRPVRPLRDAPAAARLAARGDRLDPRPRAACAGLRGPQLRLARRHRADAGTGESAPASVRAARRALRERELRVRRRGRRAARARPRRRAGGDRRRLRLDRLRQDLAPQPPASLLRPDRRPGDRRGRRHA